MWLEQSASFRSIATRFAADPTAMPSDFVSPKIAEQCADEVFKR
ncbi:MAG TPA: DNA processing protein DprA, partial [Ochrobactrum anthropi]|nr:DNA processing protein DprA [Brucella anthropi]